MDIGVVATKKEFKFVDGCLFDGIDVITTGVKTVVGIPFGIFIGKEVAHRELNGK